MKLKSDMLSTNKYAKNNWKKGTVQRAGTLSPATLLLHSLSSFILAEIKSQPYLSPLYFDSSRTTRLVDLKALVDGFLKGETPRPEFNWMEDKTGVIYMENGYIFISWDHLSITAAIKIVLYFIF